MSKKRVLQKVAGSILLASVVVGGCMGRADAEALDVSGGAYEISSYAGFPGVNCLQAQLVWIYKKVDGFNFIRLYDATNEKWLTPWLLAPGQ